MLKHRWITSCHVVQEGRPVKNILSITTEGREELQNWLREDEYKNIVRNPLLMKTFFEGNVILKRILHTLKISWRSRSHFQKVQKKRRKP